MKMAASIGNRSIHQRLEEEFLYQNMTTCLNLLAGPHGIRKTSPGRIAPMCYATSPSLRMSAVCEPMASTLCHASKPCPKSSVDDKQVLGKAVSFSKLNRNFMVITVNISKCHNCSQISRQSLDEYSKSGACADGSIVCESTWSDVSNLTLSSLTKEKKKQKKKISQVKKALKSMFTNAVKKFIPKWLHRQFCTRSKRDKTSRFVNSLIKAGGYSLPQLDRISTKDTILLSSSYSATNRLTTSREKISNFICRKTHSSITSKVPRSSNVEMSEVRTRLSEQCPWIYIPYSFGCILSTLFHFK